MIPKRAPAAAPPSSVAANCDNVLPTHGIDNNLLAANGDKCLLSVISAIGITSLH